MTWYFHKRSLLITNGYYSCQVPFFKPLLFKFQFRSGLPNFLVFVWAQKPWGTESTVQDGCRGCSQSTRNAFVWPLRRKIWPILTVIRNSFCVYSWRWIKYTTLRKEEPLRAYIILHYWIYWLTKSRRKCHIWGRKKSFFIMRKRQEMAVWKAFWDKSRHWMKNTKVFWRVWQIVLFRKRRKVERSLNLFYRAKRRVHWEIIKPILAKKINSCSFYHVNIKHPSTISYQN